MEFDRIYNRNKFITFLKEKFLPEEDFVKEETVLDFPIQTKYSSKVTRLGSCHESLDLEVYEICHTSKYDARVGLSKEAFRLLAEEGCTRALVLFVPEDDDSNYRFSLIEITLEAEENTCKIDRSYSNPHRYSYYLGQGIAYHTPNKYLNEKGRVSSVDDLRERFSVDILTKEFYSELSDWYAWAITMVRFPNDINDETDDIKYNTESTIRLITRLIFVWFLKQRHLVPDEFFDEKEISDKFLKDFEPNKLIDMFGNKNLDSHYYKAILQNLFFAMLNSPITPEGKKTLSERHFRNPDSDYDNNKLMRYENMFKNPQLFVDIANRTVPFLNGGLFDCLDDKDNGMYYDGFSDRAKVQKSLVIPDFLFFGEEVGKNIDLSDWYGDKKKKKVSARGIIDILKRYNFTVEENTPFDQEVSLDPELLGKVFENLLASFNPETQTTARKKTGSFYTPREIVQYMVDESLVAHLKLTVGEEYEPAFRQLMQYTDDTINLSVEIQNKIITSLYNCKILDPACGSGAFPMGMLQQMVHILSRIDPNNEQWKELMMNEAITATSDAYRNSIDEERKDAISDIERSFNEAVNRPDYARKLYLIENCIYGVDIQPIAIQISKLRFFISLVVDQIANKEAKDNFGIRPLPNLEAKFVAANTLIGLKSDLSITDTDVVRNMKQKLKEAKHKIFSAKTVKTKRKYKLLVNELRNELANELNRMGFIDDSDTHKLASWDMFDQNVVCDFFDSEWMFGLSNCFDIIIGNPPYVQLQKNGGELVKLYEKSNYSTFVGSGDLYCLFYECAYQLLRQSGHLCFITSNKWMRANYGKSIRKFFAEKTNPILLIDFAGVKIFESATVDTNILLFSKENNKHKTVSAVMNKQNKDGVKNLSVFVEQNYTICDFQTNESWVVLSPIEQSIKSKIESVGTPLKDWDINIYRGVLTGYNEAFIISTEKREEILANCQSAEEKQRTAELIRPILRGRDIKRYGYEWANLWLIYIPWHFPLQFDNNIQGASIKAEIEFKRLYSAVYKHMLEYKEPLSKRNKAETGIRYEWYAMQRWGAKYWEDFSKPKIVYMEIQTDNPNEGYPFPCFSYDEDNSITLNTAYIMSSMSVDIRYILGVLNSSVGRILSKLYVTQLQERQFRMLAQYLANFPIPKVSSVLQSEIVEHVQICLTSMSHKDEDIINKLVYKIYHFDDIEINCIDQL